MLSVFFKIRNHKYTPNLTRKCQMFDVLKVHIYNSLRLYLSLKYPNTFPLPLPRTPCTNAGRDSAYGYETSLAALRASYRSSHILQRAQNIYDQWPAASFYRHLTLGSFGPQSIDSWCECVLYIAIKRLSRS